MISATLLSLGGNLHPFFHTFILEPNKAALVQKMPNLEVRDAYWFPDATRFIGHNPKADPPNEDMTIHEFPSYSFVISDLHAHVINLPFVLTLLALLVSVIAKGIRKKGEKRPGLWPAGLLIAFQIGLFQMTNYWDFPIYATVTCAGLFYLFLLRGEGLSIPKVLFRSKPETPPKSLLQRDPILFFPIVSPGGITILFLSLCVGILCVLLSYPLYLILWCVGLAWVALHILSAGFLALPRTALAGIVLLAISLVVARPFSSHLTSLVNGIKLVPHHSALWQLAVIWGQFWILTALFCVVVFVGEDRLTRSKAVSGNAKGARSSPSKARAKGAVARVNNGSRTSEPYLTNLNRTFANEPGDVFILLLLLCATGLLLLPEIIYIKDIYEGGYVRSNTMFKLTYQSFVLFGVSSGYIVVRLFSLKYKSLWVGWLRVLAGLIVALIMMYPFHAINSWYGELTKERYQGLDGSIYLQTRLPDDFAAAKWLKEHVSGQPTLLEANGDSYTDHGRISVETGMPTVQGWWTHEWLWRNNQEMVSERVAHVNELYTSADVERTRELLKLYDVRYIVIGSLERDKFPQLQEEKLLGLGKVVFEQGTMKILAVYDAE